MQEVSTHSTMVTSLCELANRLVGLGVERVVMEATSDYWRPPFYLFEAHGLDPWLVNAKDVKHLPGRPKTDELDAVWLCKVAERQMLRPSFVPPERDPPVAGPDPLPGRSGRGPDRGEEPGREAARGRLPQAVGRRLRHLRRLRAGDDGRVDRRGTRPARCWPSWPAAGCGSRSRSCEEAFAGLRLGTFDDHHRFLLARMLARVDAVDADIAALDTQIEAQLAPFADAVARLDEIPGIGPAAAAVIIAEIGVDMTRFPTAAHLASWAKFAPGVSSSAGKTKGNGSTGHGDRYLARILGEAALSAGKTDTFLGARYRPPRPSTRQEEGHRRGRPLHPGDHLAPPRRPPKPLPRPRRRPLRPPREHPHQETQPHPTTRSPRLPGHPRTRRLTHPPARPGLFSD